MRRGKSAGAIRQGHSKDHRHDPKQLLYHLPVTIFTATDDGGIPVHFCTENGNRKDDVTHVPTWNLLRQMTVRIDFLYLADFKLASVQNFGHIDRDGKRFIAFLPENRSDPRAINRTLLENHESLRWVLFLKSRRNTECCGTVLSHYVKSGLLGMDIGCCGFIQRARRFQMTLLV